MSFVEGELFSRKFTGLEGSENKRVDRLDASTHLVKYLVGKGMLDSARGGIDYGHYGKALAWSIDLVGNERLTWCRV